MLIWGLVFWERGYATLTTSVEKGVEGGWPVKGEVTLKRGENREGHGGYNCFVENSSSTTTKMLQGPKALLSLEKKMIVG